MASFKYEINLPFDKTSFDDTKNAYKQIEKTISKLAIPNLKLSSEYNFYLGKLYCTCTSFEEFTQEAFGQSNFKLVFLSIRANADEINRLTVSFFIDNFSVSSDDKVMINSFIELLDEVEDSKEALAKSTVINGPVINSVIGDSNSYTKVGNDNIVTQNSTANSTIDNNMTEANKKTKDSFFKGILQNIVANWIWYALVFIVTAILVYIGLIKH